MTAYADACALIAYFGGGGQGMSPRGMAAMRDDDMMVSAITIWEITRKLRTGRLPPLPPAWSNDLCGALRAEGFRLMPLTPPLAEAANALPPHHADPMDRMLIAAALAGNAAVVTSDRVFEAYGVTTIW